MAQQKGPNDDLLIGAMIIFVVGGLAWLIWYVFDTELKNALRYVRLMQLKAMIMIYDSDYMVEIPKYGLQTLSVWERFFEKADPDDLGAREFGAITMIVMNKLKFVFSGLMGLFAIWALFKGPGTKYRRRMGLEGILAEHANNFPVISPFIKFNPSKMPVRAPGDPVPSKLPIFAEALGPEEWIAYNGIKYKNKKLDYDAAYRALAKQLGKRWRGAEYLPIHARGVYAACALKHVRKRKESDELLNELALSWSDKGGLKISSALKKKINKIVRDPKIGGSLKKYVNKHAFETTALLRALQRARSEGGVLSPSQFVWLRGYDRSLWYPLNNLGRKSYHAEAMGAMTHYTYELIAGQKIPTPKFDDAIKGLEEFVGGKSGRPIPKRVKVK